MTVLASLSRLIAGQRALLTGLTGQDGYYLARWLLARGARVYAAVHPLEMETAESIAAELGHIELAPLDLSEESQSEKLVRRIKPEIVYHLAAQSSVGVSWREPLLTARVNAMGTLSLLEMLRQEAPEASFVLAGSCDCYDHLAAAPGSISPTSPFLATNPYAVTKIMAHQMARCYRNEFGLRASVAVFFNHTSERRAPMFVERGLVQGAVRVALGLQEKVVVGSMETRRDWAWAEDLVEAFGLMGALAEPAELVLSSGQAHTVGDWVRESFAQLGLDLEKHLKVDSSRLHPGDRPHQPGDIQPARQLLGWEPRVDFKGMVTRLIQSDLRELKSAADPAVASRFLI